MAEIGTACEALTAVSGAPYVTDLAGDADGVLVGGATWRWRRACGGGRIDRAEGRRRPPP